MIGISTEADALTSPLSGRRRSLARRVLRPLTLAAVIAIAVIGGYRLYLWFTHNFHEVVAGEVYRSAQPDPERLAVWQKEHGIKTVLNLRGARPGKDWYDEEVEATTSLGLNRIDFQTSADIVVSNERMRELIAIMAEAPKPMLIHCKEGADRAGLAAALYLAAVAHAGEEAAEAQISFAYGHVSLPISPSYAMDESWENMESQLNMAGR